MKNQIANKYLKKLGGIERVKQFENAKGNPQANHFIIEFKNGHALQSYKSIVAIFISGEGYILGNHYDYSVTTGKHLTHYCGYDSKERKAKIANGTMQVDRDGIQ